MWYITINGVKLPTPYQRYTDCSKEMRRLKTTMIAVIIDCVFE